MSWRVVVVASSAKIDYRMDYLTVRTQEDVKRIHISEIGVLLVESTAVSITAYALCELTEHKAKVVFCDKLRNPVAELLPLHGSHDSSGRLRRQTKWTKRAKEAVWTEIVREKIRRQRDVLVLRALPQAEVLDGYLNELRMNDASNREGHAAKVYFNALFGLDFSRGKDCPLNAALNYGYSLILSAVNREIAAAGYAAQLGIFHDNAFNPFNLGCDFMEPLRPLIDHEVALMAPVRFEREEKMELVGLLNREVSVSGTRQHLLHALKLYCASLFRAIDEENVSEIKWIHYELPVYESDRIF